MLFHLHNLVAIFILEWDFVYSKLILHLLIHQRYKIKVADFYSSFLYVGQCLGVKSKDSSGGRFSYI